MSIKKITGASNVPNLRFPEFAGEWKETTLGKCAVDSLDYGMNAAAIEYDGKNKYIRITDIDENSSRYISTNPVSPAGELSDKYIVEPDDILFARTGASTGKTYLYNKEDGRLYFAGFLIRVRIKPEYNSAFIFAQTQTAQYHKWVQLMSIRSGQPGINSQEYASYKFLVPKKDEQNKIAVLLSHIDDRIATQIQIIKELETLMKEMSDKIFSKEFRFMTDEGNDFPDWVEKKLSELCDKTKSGGTPKSTVREYYNGNIPFLSISDMTQQGKYLFSTEKTISPEGLENSTSWIVPINSVIYSMYASVGFVSINKIELATSQAVLNLIVKPDLNMEYLYYFLCYYRKHIDKYISTGAQGNLNAETIRDFVIATPSLEEQTEIVNFLSAIDVKIDTEKQISKNYIAQKKYLLANMFI